MNRWVVSSQVLTQTYSIDKYVSTTQSLSSSAHLLVHSSKRACTARAKPVTPSIWLSPLTSRRGRMDEKTKNPQKKCPPSNCSQLKKMSNAKYWLSNNYHTLYTHCHPSVVFMLGCCCAFWHCGRGWPSINFAAEKATNYLFTFNSSVKKEQRESLLQQQNSFAIEMDKAQIEQTKKIVTQYCKNNQYKLQRKDPEACSRINDLF